MEPRHARSNWFKNDKMKGKEGRQDTDCLDMLFKLSQLYITKCESQSESNVKKENQFTNKN